MFWNKLASVADLSDLLFSSSAVSCVIIVEPTTRTYEEQIFVTNNVSVNQHKVQITFVFPNVWNISPLPLGHFAPTQWRKW